MKPVTKNRFRRLSAVACAGLVVALAGCTVVHTIPEAGSSPDAPAWNTYFLKQKFWSLPDRFVIRDAVGQPVFHVDGRFLSIGDRLRFFDTNGVERLTIRQKVLSLRHLYRIYRQGELWAKMTKPLRLFQEKYVIHVRRSPDYVIRGNLSGYRYAVFRAGRRVAEIAKRWPAWGDQYRVRVAPGQNDLLILAATVIVDMVSHRGDHHAALPPYLSCP